MLEHFKIRHDGNIGGGSMTAERKGMLGGAIRTALMFGLGIAGLYTQDAHSTPPISYCNDSGCVVYPEGNYLLGNDFSFWDWTGWHDNFPMNDWEGVTQGDVSFGGIYNSPVCNAILADGPQNCTADDMNRASGSNIDTNQLGLGANSGLGMLVRSSGNGAVVGAAIDQYISTVGGIQARQNSGIIIRLAGYELLRNAEASCPTNFWYWWDFTCTNAVATIAWELGGNEWRRDLAQYLGISTISLGVVDMDATSPNSLEVLRAEIARKNACATMYEALERNHCNV